MIEGKKENKFSNLVPVFLSIALIVGIWVGSKLAPAENQPIIFPTRAFNDVTKINEILNYITDVYVDSVEKSALVDQSIENLLEGLDPHSYYIPAKDFSKVNDPLEGNLEGIGVEFRIISDTVTILIPVENGPSIKAGIKAGDRIVKVNDSTVAGIGITNPEIIALLKGKKGSKVQVTIKRQDTSALLTYEITRDNVPIRSIVASYMMNDVVGYIKISRFSKTTHDEFVEEIELLKNLGLKKLIIDLRNNGGGYLDAATKIVDEFLSKDELIVYTEGRSRPRQSTYAESNGLLKKTELFILINEHSASASEILSGAIQDNDRGTIIGRRSFGKGLVQEQIKLPDGSAVRLTVARYYTPTGRSIQKPFGDDIDNYRLETYNRNKNGELLSPDKIDLPDSLKYFTPEGKIVYGGGGIMPDVFVPIDTGVDEHIFRSLIYSALFQDMAFEYTDKHRKVLNAYENFQAFHKSFRIPSSLFNSFIAAAKEKDLISRSGLKREFVNRIKNRLRAEIAQNIWGTAGFLYVVNHRDAVVQKALEETK